MYSGHLAVLSLFKKKCMNSMINKKKKCSESMNSRHCPGVFENNTVKWEFVSRKVYILT